MAQFVAQPWPSSCRTPDAHGRSVAREIFRMAGEFSFTDTWVKQGQICMGTPIADELTAFSPRTARIHQESAMSQPSEHGVHVPCIAHREEHDLCTRVQAEFHEMPGLRLTLPRPHGYSALNRLAVSASLARSSMRDTWRRMGTHSPARAAVADLRDSCHRLPSPPARRTVRAGPAERRPVCSRV